MLNAGKGIISVLGCGWVGLPLTKSLVSQGYTVKASTTTKAKLEVLKNERIDPYLVHFSRAKSIPDLKKFFNSEILIITIPPGRRNSDGLENYRMMVRYICTHLPHSDVSKIILISSTSVYPETNNIVDELSTILPNTESGQLMVDTEIQLSKLNIQFISLRLAGLIGPGRMPGRFFAGKCQVPNGLAPVNLIHLNDVLGIITCLVNDQNASGIYNGCAPSHPGKDEFYSLAAEIEGFEQPDFISEKKAWKIVSCSRLTKEFKYHFEIPSLMDWLHSLK
jgi:nucleoside-diphosphate-sugar epimerase